MPKIYMTNGDKVEVDDDLFNFLNVFEWRPLRDNRINANYPVVTINRRPVMMHRMIIEIITGEKIGPGMEVDHIDGNKLNNKRDNLRLCTSYQNGQNHGIHSKINKTVFIGVTCMAGKHANPYRAILTLPDKHIQIGCFETLENAVFHRDLAALKFKGEFARLNFEEKRGEYQKILDGGYNPIKSRQKSSYYHGVTIEPNGKWRAQIVINKKPKRLGIFEKEIDAARAYDEAVIKYGHDPKKLNFSKR